MTTITKKKKSSLSPKKVKTTKSAQKIPAAVVLRTSERRSGGGHSSLSRGSRTPLGHRKAYYLMGILAMGVSVSIIIYESMRGEWTPSLSSAQTAESSPTFSKFTSTTTPTDSEAQLQPEIKKSGEGGEQVASPSYSGNLEKSKKSDSLLFFEFSKARKWNTAEKINFWSASLEKDSKMRKNIALLANQNQIDGTEPVLAKKFNSMSYIETVAALSRSEGPDEFVKNLFSVRYQGGMPKRSLRNYFPDVDWLPNNQKSEILKDITTEVASSAGLSVSIAKHKVDRSKWLRSVASVEGMEKGEINPVSIAIPYIEISKLHGVLTKIPHGTLISLVHRGDEKHAGLITHQGFLIRKRNQILFRHASARGKIHTNELWSYLRQLSGKSKANKDWPLIGVNLNQINAPVLPDRQS